MALDLQAILNEAISEVLENREEIYEAEKNETTEENKEEFLDKIKKGAKHAYNAAKEQLEKGYEAAKEQIHQHPLAAGIATGATGALAAGAGALQLRKMIKKRGGLRK